MGTPFEVDVVDAVNKERLLGHFRNPPALRGGEWHVAFATYCHAGIISAYSDTPPTIPSLAIEHVDLFVEQLVENYGYTSRVVFTTRAPLTILARIREFRFAGESWEAAHHRAYYG